MPDPATLHYLGVSGYAILWLFTLVSVSVFGTRVLRHVRVLARGRAENRWDHIGRRIGLVITNVLGQRRLLDEPLIGTAHLVIFWAFIFYATTFFWNLVRGLIPALPIPYPDEVPWVSFSLETLGALALNALAGGRCTALYIHSRQPGAIRRRHHYSCPYFHRASVVPGRRWLPSPGGERPANVAASRTCSGYSFCIATCGPGTGTGPLPVDVVDPHDHRPRVPGLSALLEALALAVRALRRLLRLPRAQPNAPCFRGCGRSGGVYLAATVQRIGVPGMRPL